MRRGIVSVFALTLGWALLAGGSPASADTTVSLTFDDGNADQMPAVQMLDDHGMAGTFYIITNRVGQTSKGYMTWSQVQTIYDHGNEIGGHTRDHVHLNDSDYTDAYIQDQICGGRQDLLARGYPQVSFAYPFGDHDARSEGYVQSCGYLSGRGVAGLQRDPGEPDAETIPPKNPWDVRTRGSVDVEDTLPEIKDWIMKAEAVDAGNGPADAWIPLVFHHICDPEVTDCSDPDGVDDQYITPSDFDALLDWIQARALTGTDVKTVGEVMTGQQSQDTTPPVTQIKCDGASCQSGFYNHSVSATLTATDTGGSGLKQIRYTSNGSNPTTSSALYTGPISVNSTTTIKYRAWDNAGNAEATKSQTISIDKTAPTSSIQCNGASCSSGFYNSSVNATLSGSDTGGSGLRSIHYTTDGSTPDASDPSVANGGSVPISSTTTIKFRAEDNAGNLETATNSRTIQVDTARPTSSIQCDSAACASAYNHSVSLSLSGSDTGGSGLKNIRYTTDGSNPTGSSPVYSGAIPVSSTTTIKWRAEDNAGNVESPVNSQTISIDTADPTSAIQCDGAACSAGFYNHTVSATLSGSDPGGSGLKNIRYSTDGSNPTGSSPVYSGPINVSSTTTIKWRAEDNAGNVESIHSQTITIDTARPTSSILCDGAACEPSYDHPVQVTLSGNDTGGSALKDIRYTTDGSTPTATSPVYSDPIGVAATTTIRFRAEDNAGNVESPVNSQTIEITSEPPPPPPGGGGVPGGTPGNEGGTLGTFFSFKSLPNGTGKLTLDVTGPGELEAVDGAAGASAAASKSRTTRIKRSSKSVGQAGRVTLTIKPSKAGKRILRRKGKLTVPVLVTFTPDAGSQVVQTFKVKLRLR